MHGPYRVQIRPRASAATLLELSAADLVAGGYNRRAERFYQDAWPMQVEGALRSGVFAAADLVQAGEEVAVIVLGLDGSGKSEREIECRAATVRRDDRGRLLSTLGSRFRERVFVGV
jgi:hypothetical protein